MTVVQGLRPIPNEPPNDDHDQLHAPSISDRLRAKLLHGDAIEDLPPPEPLVEDLLDVDSLAVMFGRAGSGKTHVALDVVLHVATGSAWHGHEVLEGHVVYVVAEGARGVGQRQKAWKLVNRYHASLADRVTWHPAPVSLLGPEGVAALAEIAAERRAVLVVVDTLARSMTGANENDPKDMGCVIDACERIRQATGACVLLVHHSGKDQSAGSRGHSSLFGAVATELEVKRGEGIITVSTTKQKDQRDDVAPWRFVLVPATWTCTGCDGSGTRDGRRCRPCKGTGDAGSVALGRHTGRLADDGTLSPKAQVALDVLHGMALSDGVARTAWRDRAEVDGVGRSTFYDHVKVLVGRGLVRNVGTDKTPRYVPSDLEEQ